LQAIEHPLEEQSFQAIEHGAGGSPWCRHSSLWVTLVDGKPLLAAHIASSRAEGERWRLFDGEEAGHATAMTA